MIEGMINEEYQRHEGKIEGVIQRAMKGHLFLSGRALWGRIYTALEDEAEKFLPGSDYGNALLQARQALIERNHHASIFRAGTKSKYGPKPYSAIFGFAVIPNNEADEATPLPTYLHTDTSIFKYN
ncbi:MAG TPA: hypothetical protein VJB08_05400 [Candidatus Nanoarchaeia archaeon]|nr:hypothetical protein [Candidatus Nanoarchaeia archaeon]